MPVTILLSAQIEGWEKAYRCMPPFITPDLAASYSLLPAEDDQDSCAGCPPPGKPAVPHRNLNRDNPPPSARRCPARKGRAAALASFRARSRLVGPATTTPTPRRSAVQSGVAADRRPAGAGPQQLTCAPCLVWPKAAVRLLPMAGRPASRWRGGQRVGKGVLICVNRT